MVIENNAFQSLNNRVDILESDYVPGGGSFTIYNNNFWRTDSGSTNTLLLDYRVSIDTSDNIFRKPMFVDDSLFYLQRGSPLINAGNPELIDLDLTRSDIGWTGGMWGLLYNDYPELPPDAPDTLIGTNDGDSLHFVWSMNQEADLAIYRVYKGLESEFPLTAGSVIAELPYEDTTYVYPIVDSSSDIFFKITAVDTADLESDPSNEITLLSTGVFEEVAQGDDTIPEAPSLTAYPNPFNSVTTIRFVVPQSAGQDCYVKIVIYDILGSRIAVLQNDFMPPGIHSISWSGTDQSGRSVASGIYFASMRVSGLKNAACTKLILLK